MTPRTSARELSVTIIYGRRGWHGNFRGEAGEWPASSTDFALSRVAFTLDMLISCWAQMTSRYSMSAWTILRVAPGGIFKPSITRSVEYEGFERDSGERSRQSPILFLKPMNYTSSLFLTSISSRLTCCSFALALLTLAIRLGTASSPWSLVPMPSSPPLTWDPSSPAGVT